MKNKDVNFEDIVGRYLSITVDDEVFRIYAEESGEGIPLICLHTAGSDSRQFRHMLNDKEFTKKYRVIAFDLPWHGKSNPPEGYHLKEYKLTTDLYKKIIVIDGNLIPLMQNLQYFKDIIISNGASDF
jgi:pimeloyl-ACP methyl ester carboxylesterase